MSGKRGADENESSVLFQLSGLLAEQARKIESMDSHAGTRVILNTWLLVQYYW